MMLGVTFEFVSGMIAAAILVCLGFIAGVLAASEFLPPHRHGGGDDDRLPDPPPEDSPYIILDEEEARAIGRQ